MPNIVKKKVYRNEQSRTTVELPSHPIPGSERTLAVGARRACDQDLSDVSMSFSVNQSRGKGKGS